jgi:hypothetical protein
MEDLHSGALFYVMVAWGAVTAALAVLVIYRTTLSSREDDQLFIDQAEEHMASEQRELVSRSKRLTRPIVTLAVLSGVLLLTVAGVWLYQGFKSF